MIDAAGVADAPDGRPMGVREVPDRRRAPTPVVLRVEKCPHSAAPRAQGHLRGSGNAQGNAAPNPKSIPLADELGAMLIHQVELPFLVDPRAVAPPETDEPRVAAPFGNIEKHS